MSEISDLESRISAAMDRIGRGLEALSVAPDPMPEVDDRSAEVEALQKSLEDEKTANAQLEERLLALTSRQDELEAELEKAKADASAAEIAAQVAEGAASEAREALEAANAKTEEAEAAAEKAAEEAKAAAPTVDLEADGKLLEQLAGRLRRLRQTSRMLRASNQELRDAAQKAAPDALISLINESLKAELADLKAMRSAELIEMDVIAGTLRPMLEQPADVAKAEGDA
jgi:chromosome segregation ATPase